jgi:hypothetical protein
MYVYMYLNNQDNIKLVEGIAHRNKYFSQTITVQFRKELWKIIVNYTNKAVKFVVSLMNSEIAWDCFLRLDDKTEIFHKYMSDPTELRELIKKYQYDN